MARVRDWRTIPPEPVRAPLVRGRLLAALAKRFEHRVIVVEGGAGSGKTELLAQAVEANGRAPRGTDIWLTCTPADKHLSTLGAALLSVLAPGDDVPADVPSLVQAISDAMWRRSPDAVALVIDDLHHLPPASPGAQVLSELMSRLPRNGHVVLAGRGPLPLPAWRLALRVTLTLTDVDLAFDDEELVEFAALRGVAPELLADVGGWPALAELRVTTGTRGMLDYLRHEILSGFSPAEQSLLAAVCVMGGADAALCAMLAEDGVDPNAVFARLPLVSRRTDGWTVLHPLWTPVLREELSPGDAVRCRRDAARALCRAGTPTALDTAMSLLVDAGAWDEVGRLVRQLAEMAYPIVGTDVLDEWLLRLPLTVQQGPDGLLLGGLAAKRNDLTAAAGLFERAATGFQAAGHAHGRVVALHQLAHVCWWRLDHRRLAAAIEQIGAAVRGARPELAARAALGPVLVANAGDRQETALDLLRALPPMGGSRCRSASGSGRSVCCSSASPRPRSPTHDGVSTARLGRRSSAV
jgi:ATP/maltotriose-dependent transcriptional regulator MalT